MSFYLMGNANVIVHVLEEAQNIPRWERVSSNAAESYRPIIMLCLLGPRKWVVTRPKVIGRGFLSWTLSFPTITYS